MVVAFPMIVMSSAFFNPSFAFSSHFDTDGAPLSELSWPSSLAVVAVSFSGLFTFVFLMLACLCCKKGDIGFKVSSPPPSADAPVIYILPLTEVSLPVSKQPGRSIQLLKSSNLGRHSLLYLKEIGHGWFGKVLLGEVNAGVSTTQVVVKELKSSASVQDQMQFLEEAQPYRALQNPALLQCLAQCTEVTPYLLVMEFCPLGDLKSYLRSCRAADAVTPDPLILQRMACEIASGLLHLHKYNFIHSDLALRNCLLTSDMSVKIGDYGLSHSRYKEDYFVTPDQIWVPLRWISPELIDEVHGNLLVVDQTKTSNVWTLGVTIWELFELGNQPYRHYSDRQVLTYAVKEQQLKLPKPLLKVPLADRWYEVMQFCWLQPEQRPSTEEVHLLLTYLCAKGASEAEEDFEQRWNSLRPNLLGSTSHSAPAPAPALTPTPAPDLAQAQAVELASSASSSFPLLERFSSDGFHSDTGDDILTVTETSRGLNFEYKWEQARAEQLYCSSSTSGPLGQGNPHYQDIYYPITGGTSGACKASASPSYYESDPPGVVPVLSAHSPSVSNEYYIRIEEPVECNIDLDDSVADYSPGLEASHASVSTGGRSGPPAGQPSAFWSSAERGKPSAYDSDASPTVSLTMEPLLRHASTSSPEELGRSHHHYFSPNHGDSPYCERSPTNRAGHRSQEDTPSASQQSFLHPIGRLETPRGVSQPVSSPSLGYCDPYLEANQGTLSARSMVSDSYCDMIGPLRKSLPIANHISIDVETGDGLLVGRRRGGDTVDDSDLFSEVEATNWTSNHSANNNSLTWEGRQTGFSQDSYFDLHCTTLSSTTTDSWPTSTAGSTSPSFFSAQSFSDLDTTGGESSSTSRSDEFESYIHLCHEGRQEAILSGRDTSATYLHNIDSLSSSVVQNVNLKAGFKEGSSTVSAEGGSKKPSTFTGERLSSEPQRIPEAGYVKSPSAYMETHTGAMSDKLRANIWEVPSLMKDVKVPGGMSSGLEERRSGHSEGSEASRGLDSGLETGVIMVDIGDCSDEDDDITSGIYADFPLDYMERDDDLSPLQNPVGTPDSVDTMTLSCSAASPCEEAFSPDAFNASILPKSLDSGYDTENNESPEFILKEHGGDSREGEVSPSGEGEEPELVLQVDLDQGLSVCTSSGPELQLKNLTDKGRYRDSAYFSDAENEKSPRDEGSNFFTGSGDQSFLRYAGKQSSSKKPGSKAQIETRDPYHLTNQRNNKAGVVLVLSEPDPCSTSPSSTPGLSMLAPFPPQMGGCLTKESSPDDGLGLETENSGEDPISDCSSTLVSEPSSAVQEGSANQGQENRGSDDYSPVQSLGSDSTIVDYGEEVSKEREDGEGSTEGEEEDFPEFNHVEEEEQMGRKPTREEEEDEEEEEQYGSQGGFVEDQNGSMEMLTSSCSFLVLCGEEARRAPLEEAEDDSDDSESDEELRTYSLQGEEESEESEEDLASVPVVVSDRSGNRHLRSLLKMPTLLSQSFCDELDRKKKAVSFFDDVTVFLFDQESPTGELAEYSFPPGAAGAEPSGQALVGDRPLPQLQPLPLPSPPQESVNASEDLDGNISEESGRFEWEEDFSLVPSPSVEEPVPDLASDPVPVPAAKAPEDKPAAAAAFSRFSVSRFSITHVSDSDMDSAGGSENGERE
ncbi:serine/threonine-protein kinase LMTK1 isoform X3 [Osmerus mordax]|uniref:serine/threonine-protein kinase LMTK1 isoform X3 n=2 Tax=Osmerus mordax TaxID=8014 RepID=UPI00350FB9D9